MHQYSQKDNDIDPSDMKLPQKVYELIPAVCLFLSKEDPVHKDRIILMTSGHFSLDHIHVQSIVFVRTFCPKYIIQLRNTGACKVIIHHMVMASSFLSGHLI